LRLQRAICTTQLDVFVQILVARAQTDDRHRIGLMSDLLARHGGETEDSKPTIGQPHRATLCAVLDGWITTLLAARHPVRHTSSQVARAAERLADASLAEPLGILLERDLADYAAELASYHPGRGAAVMDYSPEYARAFRAMHDAPAVAVLTRGLSDLRWGIYAAGALYEIWSTEHLPKDERIVAGWATYYQHLSRRAERATGTPPTSEFAEAIFVVVRRMGDPTKSDAEQRHALGLAVPGLAMPHGAKRREIDALLALPQPITKKHRLLSAAARAGEVIPATLLMGGVQNLVEAAQTQTWRLDENRGELTGWIDLFPFSDDPKKVHDALAILPERCRQPHALRGLLRTVLQGPADSALACLERLAADNPAFQQNFEWIDAVIRLDTEAAAIIILDLFCAGQITIRNAFQLSRALAAWARRYPAIRTAMIARYRATPAGDMRTAIERAFNDSIDEDIFMTLFEAHVDDPYPPNSVLTAIRTLAIGRKPSEEWADAFEEFGLPLTGLRARLFAMLPTNNPRARLAEQCLIAIEEHRDYYGRVNNEPRHPDIATGRPWPLEAAEPLAV
jgi:hypothetical protein